MRAYRLQSIANTCHFSNALLRVCCPLSSCFATAAIAQTPASRQAPEISLMLVYFIIIFVLILILFGIAAVRVALSNSTWSLADALSEEVEVTFKEKIDGDYVPKFDDNLKPVMLTQLAPSSSRLIAFIGLIAILAMFIGFGAFSLYYFAFGDGVPNGLDDVIKFLLAAMTMFAPYIVNKFASIFDWMNPRKS
jgi:hypothetical protein